MIQSIDRGLGSVNVCPAASSAQSCSWTEVLCLAGGQSLRQAVICTMGTEQPKKYQCSIHRQDVDGKVGVRPARLPSITSWGLQVSWVLDRLEDCRGKQ
eukprot:6479903-Amphidinium_carterae.1